MNLDFLENFFNSLSDAEIIGDENTMLCDFPITPCEIKDAIKSLKSNKSPDSDGLTSEFSKMFSEELTAFYIVFSLKASVMKDLLHHSSPKTSGR